MTSELTEVTPEIREVVEKVRELAIEFEKVMGKKLDITGDIGEILVADLLGLRLATNPGLEGYDAVDKNGKRVQIKARRSEKRQRPTDRGWTSRFSKGEVDYAILATVSRDYRIIEVWKASYSDLLPQIEKSRRRDVRIGVFKKIGEKIQIWNCRFELLLKRAFRLEQRGWQL